ncbi:hypothetical protein MAM1_0079c04451 [Mucor ambiguus]|uniref:Uncharacterized protein n=1 Tax=Mucor ambiguus TaxID=91626 RepID=A0A0C9MSC9_9FUNG|nr:hypothetical protein MAM1_0079c04451 [Mucor ambiguus]
MLDSTIHNTTILEEEEQDMDSDVHIMNLTDTTIYDNVHYNQDITRLSRHNKTEPEEEETKPVNGDDDHYLSTSSSSVDLSPNSRCSKTREHHGGVYASACVDADSIVDADFDANYASLDDTTAAFQHQQHQQSDINSLLPCSSSSLNMYHQHRHLPSTSTSTCSSYTSRMMLLDEDIMSSVMTTATSNASAATLNTHHDAGDSILMKQALKQAQQRKRRESIGEVVTTRKRPASTSVIPRLTKSSILQTNNSTNSTSNSRKRSFSNIHHNNSRRKYYSLQQPLSQFERNKLASLEPSVSSSSVAHSTAGGSGVHWDPHIDAFEILRAKITGITRSMQEFHVQELFHDEIMGQKRRQTARPSRTISSPIITTDYRGSSNKRQLKGRRFSMANLNESNSLYLGHRRIKSQSFVPNDKDEDEDDDNKQEDETLKRSFNHYRMHQDYSSYNHSEEEEEEEDDLGERQLRSPNLTALFTTTNSLINSRLDELSETASIKSNTSQLEWQKQFLSLVTSCIHQSEALESLSTDVLNAEHRVRELMLVNDTLHEQFHEREKQYEERIRECQQVAHQQLVMIDSLEELTADINMKMESRRREMHRQEALRALDANNTLQDEELELQQQQNERWNFQRSVADLLNMDDKHDVIQKMRWEIGMFVGGGVGTGHVIHSYQDRLNGIDMMIAGTGTTTAPYRGGDYQYSDQEEEEEQTQTTTFSVSPSIHHIRLYQHQYILHLSSKDRQTRFSLLPKCLWVPDHETNQCQFQQAKRHLQYDAALSSAKDTALIDYRYLIPLKCTARQANGAEYVMIAFVI